MTLASVIAAALALVDGEPILEFVWVPARAGGGLHRARCYVLTGYGWRLLYGMHARIGMARSRRTDPWLDR